MGDDIGKRKYKEKIKMGKFFKNGIFLLFIILLLSVQLSAIAQNSMIPNDSMRFSIVFTSYNPIEDSAYHPLKFHIIIENTPSQTILDHYAQMDTSMIFSLLDNPKYDWATNLVLYSIYGFNADVFFAFDIKTREDWIGYFQDKDLAMWRDFFKRRKETQSTKIE